MLMDQLGVVWMLHHNSKLTLVVFIAKLYYSHKSIMKYLLLDGELKEVKNIGLLEIHGEHIGENGDSLELKCIVTIWLLKLIVIGVFQLSVKLKNQA